MPNVPSRVRHLFSSRDLRILALMLVGLMVCGVLDGSLWQTLLAPTIAYRPAFLFGLMLVFGWRGFVWSQVMFLVFFVAFLGWKGAVFVTPLWVLSNALSLMVAQRLAKGQPWLSSERSTIAFLFGAVLAPAIPALFGSVALPPIGINPGPGVPAAIESWIRGAAATLAMVPAVLWFGSGPWKKWVGWQPDRHFRPPVYRRMGLQLAGEAALWTVTLWISVQLKAHYGLNVTYLTFLPPLAFTFFRGMGFAVLALASNTIIATTLWQQLHWAGDLSTLDLRLLIAICSLTVLLLAAVVDARQRGQVEIRKLRAAEIALRLSEDRFRFAQRAASIGTFDWNLQTGLSAWTPELEALYGLPPGSFAGSHKAWESLIHPDDVERVLQRVRESLQTGTPTEDEWRVVWPDGSLHWITGRWQIVRNETSEPGVVLGINIDVTERKNMEEALRRSEERFRLASKATKDAIWDIDLKTGTVGWNDTYTSLYGRPETADSWQFWIDRIHPEDRFRTVEDFQTSLNNGATSWSAEYRLRRADGEWANIHDRAYIARDASGNAWRVIGAMQDLTERRKSEAALRESEERFRSVFEEGPLGLALVGKDYRFEKVNNALCKMTRYDEAELVRMSFVDITHPDDVQMDLDLANKLFGREIPTYCIQKRYVKKNGEFIWINLTASMIHGPDGEPLHGLAMVEDITETKRRQEESFSRQKLESVGTLASGIAHDFNNILGAVLAQAEVALAELPLESPLHEELKSICQAAMRGSEIVRELMIYAGKDSETPGFADLSELGEEMLALLKVSVSKRAILKTDFEKQLPPVRANPAQLSQILMNLVANASEAIGDREGTIQVAVRRVTVGADFPGFDRQAEDKYVQLEVSDTGTGMSPETRARVFDPFFSTKSPGRGLGLAVVHGIVRGLGGTIHLASELGLGTTFLILLPCAAAASTVVRGQASEIGQPQRPFQSATVLLVEDEEPLRQAASKMLHKCGFFVIEAADGSTALDAIRAQDKAIDILFLDVTLPGISSRVVLEEAKRLRPQLKVVVTSAYSKEMAAESLQTTIKHFLRKPYRLSDLVGLIQLNSRH